MKIGDFVKVANSLSGVCEGKIIEFRGGNTLAYIQGIGIVSVNECKLIK